METDWVQVVAALVVGVGVGVLLILNAERVSGLQQAQMEAMRYPKRMRGHMTPGLVRLVGAAFIFVGIVGAVLGLFFADKM